MMDAERAERLECLDLAVDAVARRILANLAELVSDEWGNYPEIGEDDWLAVQGRVASLALSLDTGDATYRQAYSYLEQRAVAWERGH